MRPYIIRQPGNVQTHTVNSRLNNKRVSYSLSSTLESVNTAEQKAFEVAEKAGFAEDEQYHISMAVREAAECCTARQRLRSGQDFYGGV